jgi:prefoldin subunit 5
LLKLQTDIQKENDMFFHKEIERLRLVDQSANSKLQELSRRADEKTQLLQEVQRKVDLETAKYGSPMKTH